MSPQYLTSLLNFFLRKHSIHHFGAFSPNKLTRLETGILLSESLGWPAHSTELVCSNDQFGNLICLHGVAKNANVDASRRPRFYPHRSAPTTNFSLEGATSPLSLGNPLSNFGRGPKNIYESFLNNRISFLRKGKRTRRFFLPISPRPAIPTLNSAP